MLCEGLVSPQDSGIGGGFTGIVKMNREVFMVDAREVSPKKLTKLSDIKNNFYEIGVPGALRGYQAIHRRWGKMNLRKIIEYLEVLCKNGVPADRNLLRIINHYQNFKHLIGTNGKMRNIELCNTLSKIKNKGINHFYNTISEDIIKDLHNYNNKIEKNDFVRYRAKITKPSYKRLNSSIDFYSTSYPGVGKVLLEDVKKIFNSKYDIIEIQREFYKSVPKYRYYEYSKKIPKWKVSEKEKKHGTTNICIQDDKYNCLCFTSTINRYFGSNFISNSTGVILNNQLKDFPDYYNKSISRISPPSYSSVIIMLKNKKPILMMGGTGGYRIPSGVLNVMYNIFRNNMTFKDAIDNPRLFSNKYKEIRAEKCYLTNRLCDKYYERVNEMKNNNVVIYDYSSYNTVTGIYKREPVFDLRRGGYGLRFSRFEYI
ncbi:uncharacterized protein [Linepithema humile]|uniref:uncharacterized protein n=2 Tax=Linepithema humile TaxID=83485 RepID=UPI00351E61B9